MKGNPYVGPRPYERGDRHHFYGRDREARELRVLIVAEREVLFYAQSGVGKKSLLNAMMIPALEEKGFRVLPTARVGSELPPEIDPQSVSNVFVFSTLLALAGGDVFPKTLLPHTLRSFLEEFHPTPEAEFEFQPLVLILDQFEEIFTTHRERWQDARGFFMQIREVPDALPHLDSLCHARGLRSGNGPTHPAVSTSATSAVPHRTTRGRRERWRQVESV